MNALDVMKVKLDLFTVKFDEVQKHIKKNQALTKVKNFILNKWPNKLSNDPTIFQI